MPNRTDWRSILRNLRAHPWFALVAMVLLGAGFPGARVPHAMTALREH